MGIGIQGIHLQGESANKIQEIMILRHPRNSKRLIKDYVGMPEVG